MASLFPVEREYARCVAALNSTGILMVLPKSGFAPEVGAGLPRLDCLTVICVYLVNTFIIGIAVVVVRKDEK